MYPIFWLVIRFIFFYDIRRDQFEVVTFCGMLGNPALEGESLAARKS
jgi:hypothetical protein